MEAVNTSNLATPEFIQQQQFNVLVVDDSKLDRTILEKQLLTISCSSSFIVAVTSVDSGEEALKALGLVNVERNQTCSDSTPTISPQSSSDLEQESIHMIFTDYSMPGMTGYDLLKRIKSSCWKDIPVVVVSAEDIPSRIRKCLEEGAVEFLLKPPNKSDLEGLIQRYLNKSLDSGNTSTKEVVDNASTHGTSCSTIGRM